MIAITDVIAATSMLAAATGGAAYYATYGVRSQWLGRTAWHGRTDTASVALTFDDGPTTDTLRILDVLAAHDVRIRLIGDDFAIIHARTSYTTATGEQRQGRYTDVWARRAGRWVAVSAHVTRSRLAMTYMTVKIPMGRTGRPELVAWLASDACSVTTGGVFDISGGRATYWPWRP